MWLRGLFAVAIIAVLVMSHRADKRLDRELAEWTNERLIIVVARK